MLPAGLLLPDVVLAHAVCPPASAIPPLSALPAERKCVLQLQREALLLAVVCSVVSSARGAATCSALTTRADVLSVCCKCVGFFLQKNMYFCMQFAFCFKLGVFTSCFLKLTHANQVSQLLCKQARLL